MKRILATILAISMIFGLVACSSGSSSTDSGSDSGSNVTESNVYPFSDETIVLNAMCCKLASVEDYETNAFTNYVEELCGIEFNFELVTNGSETEALNVLLATGVDLPDVFIGFSISNEMQLAYGQQEGMFIDMVPYLDTYGQNILAMYEDLPVLETLTKIDGALYGVPSVGETYHVQYRQKAWINQATIDAIDGFEMPQTIDDFTNLLIQIRDTDPNGNGIADEIPFTGGSEGWAVRIYAYIMSAFMDYYEIIGMPEELSFTIVDGEIESAYTQDAYKEGLEYLNYLYNEGLLDPNALTNDWDTLHNLCSEDEIIVGVVTAGAPVQFTTGTNEEKLQWVTLEPLENENGEKYSMYSPIEPSLGAYVITNECENIEAAVRLADYFVTTEGTLSAAYGIEGVDWSFVDDESKLGLNGEPAFFETIAQYGDTQNVSWYSKICSYQSALIRNGMYADETQAIEVMLYNETEEKYNAYNDEDKYLLPFTVSDSDLSTYVDTSTALETYVAQASAEFVLGKLDFDSDWDDYLANLEALGNNEFMEIVRASYADTHGTVGIVAD